MYSKFLLPPEMALVKISPSLPHGMDAHDANDIIYQNTSITADSQASF